MPILRINNNNDTQDHYSGIFTLRAEQWWLPNGILPSNVIAAYQFKGVASEASALLNLNNTAVYSLTKVGGTVTWNQSTGFYIPATVGYGLNNASITSFSSVFARFSDAANGNYYSAIVSPALGYTLMAKAAFENNGAQYRNSVGIADQSSSPGTGYYGATYYSYGVLGWNRTSRLVYVNGVSQSLTGFANAYISNPTYILIGQGRLSPNITSFTSYNLQAVAFYNTELTADQVVQLSSSMAAL